MKNCSLAAAFFLNFNLSATNARVQLFASIRSMALAGTDSLNFFLNLRK